MASKTIRQLATETGRSVDELCQFFGKASGSDTVTDEEIQSKGKARQQPRPQQQTSAPGGNAMFTEVAQKVDQQLDPVALRMRLYAQQSLEHKLAGNICNLSSEEAIALLEEIDGQPQGIQDNFDFFSQTAGHMDLSSCVQAIASGTDSSKQLVGAAVSQDSSPKPETILTTPLSEPGDSTQPPSGKGFVKS